MSNDQDAPRVLAVTNMYPTSSEPWFGSFVRDQIEALRRLGVTVEVLSFDGRRDVRAYATAARAVRALAADGDFDVVHAHYGLAGAVALCQRSAPVVTTFHGSDSMEVAWQRCVSWFVARRSTPIFVAAANARRLGLPNAIVLPVGVDTKLFHPVDRADARRALGWDVGPTYVLFPATRAIRSKRADLFDRTVDLVDEAVPGVRRVSLEGYSREQVASVMNAVDVVLLTSDWEGSPVSVKEALACATPVVSVPVGDVPDILKGLPGCAIAPRDPQALASGVLDALGVRDEALRGRSLEFSHDRIATQILEIYGRVQQTRSREEAEGPVDANGAC